MKCDHCSQPGISLVGESNHIVVCIDHAREWGVWRAENDAPWCPECGPTCPLHGSSDENDARLNEVARAICDSEAFMWLMVGANHPEAHLSVLRQAWRDHYLPNGGGYGARIRARTGGIGEWNE